MPPTAPSKLIENVAVMDEQCIACGSRLGDHWVTLEGQGTPGTLTGKRIGWIGCAGALAQKVVKS